MPEKAKLLISGIILAGILLAANTFAKKEKAKPLLGVKITNCGPIGSKRVIHDNFCQGGNKLMEQTCANLPDAIDWADSNCSSYECIKGEEKRAPENVACWESGLAEFHCNTFGAKVGSQEVGNWGWDHCVQCQDGENEWFVEYCIPFSNDAFMRRYVCIDGLWVATADTVVSESPEC